MYFSSSFVFFTTLNKGNLSFSYIFHPIPIRPNQTDCVMEFLETTIFFFFFFYILE